MLLELENIHKHFGRVKANNGISLTFQPGSIHGILGENGAGKSTLMKILSGYQTKTSGAIRIDGAVHEYHTPAEATRLGIGMLYQDPLDFPPLKVLENFALGQTQGLLRREASIRGRFEACTRGLGFSLDPALPVADLTVGERQQLEIARLIDSGVHVLILDEPTTGISGVQKAVLFEALRTLAGQGKIIILVSHKLEEVLNLCHAVTVLRGGKVAGGMRPPYDDENLLAMMFGAPPALPLKPAIQPGEDILVMENVSGSGGRAGLAPCSLTLRRGEVVGLAGLEGSGQDVLLRLAAGIETPATGKIAVNGRELSGRDHLRYRKHGVAFLPAARLEQGLIPGLSIQEHYALKEMKGFVVRWDQAYRGARDKIKKFQVRGRARSCVESLSGGNQQRLLLSFLPIEPNLLLLENPTRGLDMESVRWVWEHLLACCRHGAGIIFSSSELDEIIMAADRVLVFFEGRIIKDVRTDDTDARELGMAIAGKA